MSTLADRITAGVDSMGLSLAEFCRQAGLPSTNYITRIKSGDLRGRRHLALIASRLGCTVEWLINGTGQAPTWAATVIVTDTMDVPEPPASGSMPNAVTVHEVARHIEGLRVRLTRALGSLEARAKSQGADPWTLGAQSPLFAKELADISAKLVGQWEKVADWERRHPHRDDLPSLTDPMPATPSTPFSVSVDLAVTYAQALLEAMPNACQQIATVRSRARHAAWVFRLKCLLWDASRWLDTAEFTEPILDRAPEVIADRLAEMEHRISRVESRDSLETTGKRRRTG